jgi:hypothetical protein
MPYALAPDHRAVLREHRGHAQSRRLRRGPRPHDLGYDLDRDQHRQRCLSSASDWLRDPGCVNRFGDAREHRFRAPGDRVQRHPYRRADVCGGGTYRRQRSRRSGRPDLGGQPAPRGIRLARYRHSGDPEPPRSPTRARCRGGCAMQQPTTPMCPSPVAPAGPRRSTVASRAPSCSPIVRRGWPRPEPLPCTRPTRGGPRR